MLVIAFIPQLCNRWTRSMTLLANEKTTAFLTLTWVMCAYHALGTEFLITMSPISLKHMSVLNPVYEYNTFLP